MRIKFASPNAENMNYPDTYSKEEQLEMDKQYDVLLKAWNGVKKEADIELVKKAYEFAALAHKDARRKSGEPYIFHPIAVAIIVAQEIGMGATSITSALLHDVVEDTDYTVEYISKEFGPKVARVVKGLTKLSSIDFQNSIESIQAENYRKIVNTMSEDIRVILVRPQVSARSSTLFTTRCGKMTMMILNLMLSTNTLEISATRNTGSSFIRFR